MTVYELIRELTKLPSKTMDDEVVIWHDEKAFSISFFEATAESGPTIFTAPADGSDPLA